MITRIYKAPSWFEQVWDIEIEGGKKKLSILLGVEYTWFVQANPEILNELCEKLSDEEQKTYLVIGQHVLSAKEYLFNRYRYENIDTPQIAFSETLTYDYSKKKIKAMIGFSDIVSEAVEKVKGMFGTK